jgi:hypothetical protein
MGCTRGVAGTGRWEAAGAGRARHPAGRAPSSPGSRRHPPRSYLTSAERGNPVRVRALVAPGKPTVRKAQFPGGNRMTRQANAGGRKAAGNRDHDGWLLRQRHPDNWPDTGRVPGPERAQTRVR